MNVVVQHIPHAIPVVAIWGIMLRFWLAQRRLVRGAEAPLTAAETVPAAAPIAALPSPVRRRVAVRGLVALGPLLGALATGLVIYALNLGAGHAAAAAIWAHVGISLLAMLLVAYKVAELGWSSLRQRTMRSASSLVLLALWVPLLGSGVALLIAPSQASFTAYAHLIASVWWTGLLLWHLRRYLARAARTARDRPATAVGPGPTSAGAGIRSTRPRRPSHGSRPGSPAAKHVTSRRHAPASSESETAGVSSEESAGARLRGS